MKNIFLIACLICIANVLLAQTNAIEQIEQKRYRLMQLADTAALAAIMDDNCVYIHSNGMIDTKQSFLQSIATKNLIHKNITIQESAIRMLTKKVAVVTGKCVYDITYHNEDMVLKFVFTNIYQKQKGKWLLVNRQTSPLK
jgi:ketosteroid isomerase-like protein